MAGGRTTLEIEDDAEWQFVEWRIHRVLWVVGASILVAAMLGLLGSGGPLAEASAETAGVTIHYERFGRWSTPASFTIEVERPSEQVEVRVGSAFLGKARIERIDPEPESAVLSAEGYTLTFTAEPGAPKQITVHYEPDEFGRLSLETEVDGRDLGATSFVYP